MKKLIVSAFMLTLFASSYASSNYGTNVATTTINEDQDKTKVDPAALPDAVKATLASDAYKGWNATTAWEVKADPAYYEIELAKDGKTNVVKIDKDGKVK